MSNPANTTIQPDLKSAIVINPLVVAPETKAMEAIAQMINASANNDSDPNRDRRLSCVLIIENTKVVGIITERDVVRLIVQQRSLETLTVSEVMSSPVVTMRESEFTDLFLAAQVLKQQRIGHLPILDRDDQLLGLITHESLLQLTRPVNCLLEPPEWDFKQSEQRFISLATVAPVGIFCTDIEGNCLYVNDRWCQIAGLTTSEALGLGWMNAIYLPDRSLVTAAWKTFVQGSSPFSLEYRFQNASGLITWVYGQAVSEYNNTGKIIGYVGAITNISDRKSAEATLQESEERLRLALRAANQGLYDLNIQTGEAIVSPEYATMLGYDPETFQETNARWIDRLHPDDLEVVANTYRDYIAGNITEYKVEFRQRTQAGEWKWLLSLGQVLEWDELGNPLRMLGTHTDISDRKHGEAALAELAAIVESSMDAIISKTLDGVIVSWNAGAERLFGYTAKETIGQPITLIIPLELTDEETYILEKIKRGEPISHYETIRQDKAGKMIDMSLTVSPIRDPSGAIIGASKIARDISELKQAEARLQQLNQELEAKVNKRTQELWQVNSMQRAILDSADYSFISTDALGLIQSFNPAAERMLGYSASEVIGKLTPAIFHDLQEIVDRSAVLSAEIEQDIPVGFEVFVAKARLGIVSEEEWTYIRKDGSRFPVLLSVTAMRDVNQQIIGFLGIAKDISDRKQLELQIAQRTEALQASEATNRAMLEAIPDLLLRLRRDGTCLDFIKPAINSENFLPIAHHISEVIPPELLRNQLQIIDRAILTRELQVYEHKFIKQGRTTYEEVRILAINDNEVLAIVRDISDRKQVEAALKKSEQRYRALLNNASDAIFQTSLQGNLIETNHSAELLLGYSLDELMRLPMSQIHPPEVLETIQNHFRQIIQNGEGTILETLIVCKDGKQVPVEINPSVIDLNGETIVQAIFRDLTERKQAEAEIIEKQRFIQKIADASPNILYLYDLQEYRNVYCNREIADVLGYTSAEVQAMGANFFANLMHPDDLARMPNYYQQIELAQDGDIFEIEYRMRHVDGEYRWLISRDSIFSRDEQGQPKQTIGTAQDITDRKKAELKLQQTTAQLEASNRELEAFAYSVSHDLRAPLRAIDGFSNALIEDYGDKFDAEGRDYFDRIRRNVQRMGMLIDDLLRLSRVSRSEMQCCTVNLSNLVQEQVNELRESEPERQVELEIAANIIVSADPTLMRVVISNLVQNAWKFTSHHATARIEFDVIEREGQSTYFVRDDGAGFDMNHAKMLFKVFQRLHNTNEFNGTGIGLATVQRVIHRHGGQIWAEGIVEKGATIYFTLPNISVFE
ncbi:MAG: hypothetical protein DCF19_11565 [Pseudanabaena frigida]|uniref:histidine kinase n=1 Tax=Pseudanabaena frigida TaxID=945775 RepID=A0A2W4W5Y4_9CYAN|nr:MAG: hypothetical protein DCF19_11565 [Pseudanabaena frigida]